MAGEALVPAHHACWTQERLRQVLLQSQQQVLRSSNSNDKYFYVDCSCPIMGRWLLHAASPHMMLTKRILWRCMSHDLQ